MSKHGVRSKCGRKYVLKMTLEAIKYTRGDLKILDQLLLPAQSTYIPVKNTEDGWNAIKKMQVRGAPAIGIVGSLSLAIELGNTSFSSHDELCTFIEKKLNYLVSARPTAVNMADSATKLTALCKRLSKETDKSIDDVKLEIIVSCEKMLELDIQDNKAIGKFGATDILKHYSDKPVRMLTHCNTGSLATAGYGTALGVIRALHDQGKLDHAYCTETRPYNQGCRLTAYELVYDKVPATLICDSMASILMKEKNISAVVVGADRVVSNGDTANKIGTYQLAIAAKYHGVPFYVAAPTTSIDLNLKTGKSIVIEERPELEMVTIHGTRIAAEGISVWNPAFDVTPAELITGGIVTEFGVFSPSELKEKVTEALKEKNK